MGMVTVRGRLPQDVLLWHTDHFVLKHLEKQLVQGYSDPLLSPGEREIHLSNERHPLGTRK